MNKKLKFILSLALISISVLHTSQSFAGNPDRVGQAGAGQFLVNPWAGASGMGASFVSGIKGVESMSLNAAGLSGVAKTDFQFSNTSYLGSSVGIKINSFGMGQRIGKSDVLGVYFSSYDLGTSQLTTVSNPDNTQGTFSINYLNLGVAYSHQFSKSITTGITMKAVQEGTAVVNATGFAIDAGIQYATGDSDRIKFGLSLRNIGTAYGYSGSGLSKKALVDGSDNNMTIESRVQAFEMPTVLQIGASYDFFFDTTKTQNVLTVAASFSSNAFDKDQGRFGVQYSLKKMIFLRAGYVLETNISTKDQGTKSYAGPSGGLSLAFPFGKDKGKLFAVDYSYTYSRIFSGSHNFGIRFNL